MVSVLEKIFSKRKNISEPASVVLDKTVISLSKENSIEIPSTQVILCLDISGSMYDNYISGYLQILLERLVPISVKFDDNSILETIVFNNHAEILGNVTPKNYLSYVKRHVPEPQGGTIYSSALDKLSKFVSREIPTLCLFLTDGDNFEGDNFKTFSRLRELSGLNLFIQFVGMGNSEFKLLKQIDALSNRVEDNTGFITFEEIDKVSDKDLYIGLLSGYIDWLKRRDVN